MNILVADGDSAHAGMLSECLRGLGHDAFEAASFDDACDMAAQIHPDLAFVSWELPGGPGFSLLGLLKAAVPGILCVAMAGQNERERELLARKHGVIAYICKPVEEKIICAIIGCVQRRKAL
ncbi:MAG: response regulator [Desulfatibacillaceae bacterium]|nr:response regulator [Desulfatibacillaceae bacterium]